VWGDKGEGPGKLNAPVAFATDTQGKLYFADPGGGFIHKFESNGTPLLSFEDSRLLHASGIAVDSGGGIYVADAARGSILIFFPEGDFLRAIRVAPQPHFSGVIGIGIDGQGNAYVPDALDSRIIKFDQRGRLIKSWKVPQSIPSEADKPSFVTTGADDSIFVAYAKTARIEKYSPEGMLVSSWKMPGTDTVNPGSTITGIAVTDRFVFTASSAAPRIRVWTLEGQLKLADDLGGRLGDASTLQIAVTPRGELLVFDPSAIRVFQFQTHLQ